MILTVFADEVQVVSGGERFQALVLPGGFNGTSQEVRIIIRSYAPRRLAELSLLSNDGSHGRYVEAIQWATKADEELEENYLVFTTSSADGTAPWHFVTYIFSTRHWRFLCLDEVLAKVTSSEFSFRDATHLVIEMLENNARDISQRSPQTIDLESLPWNDKVKNVP